MSDYPTTAQLTSVTIVLPVMNETVSLKQTVAVILRDAPRESIREFQRFFSALYGTQLTDRTFAYRIFPTQLVQSILNHLPGRSAWAFQLYRRHFGDAQDH